MKEKFYDIGQELFSAPVYPGDPRPEKKSFLSIEKGDSCNLTVLSMGSHNGTHLDAPRHFIKDGQDAASVPLDHVMGECKVVESSGELSVPQVEHWLTDGTKKLLIKGDILVTEASAQVMVNRHLTLLGVEGQTVGDENTQERIHQILLGTGIVILEGLSMSQVLPGTYFLAAQPLKMAGLDGSPVRPVLISK